MKFILLTIISILLISTATFGVLYYKERKKCDLIEIESTLNKNHLKSINESLKGAFLDSQNYNNVKLILPISSEGSKDFVLCLFISKYHCIACVNAALEYYVASKNIIPDSNMVILTDFNPNAIKHLKAEYQLKCNIISVFDC